MARKRKPQSSLQEEARIQEFEDMDDCLKKTTCAVGEFDDDLVRRLLQNVKVINDEKLKIQFKSGIVIGQRIAYDE